MGESFSLTLTWEERVSFELIKNRKKGGGKKHPVPRGTRLILILCLIFFSNLPPLGARVVLALMALRVGPVPNTMMQGSCVSRRRWPGFPGELGQVLSSLDVSG